MMLGLAAAVGCFELRRSREIRGAESVLKEATISIAAIAPTHIASRMLNFLSLLPSAAAIFVPGTAWEYNDDDDDDDKVKIVAIMTEIMMIAIITAIMLLIMMVRRKIIMITQQQHQQQ